MGEKYKSPLNLILGSALWHTLTNASRHGIVLLGCAPGRSCSFSIICKNTKKKKKLETTYGLLNIIIIRDAWYGRMHDVKWKKQNKTKPTKPRLRLWVDRNRHTHRGKKDKKETDQNIIKILFDFRLTVCPLFSTGLFPCQTASINCQWNLQLSHFKARLHF